LKLPHHGSCRDIDKDFFKRIVADHYVISADGTNGNPDNETLRNLSDARGGSSFTIHLTNKTGKNKVGPRLAAFFASEVKKGKKYKVNFRDPKEPSLKVDLLDPLLY
jgi:beta-lactamase superfamily II metal-dependent hydrolase